MNKEEISLIQCDILLTYIKNGDSSTYYKRNVEHTCIDNEILENEDFLYITTVNKYQSLKKENKILRENAEHNDKVVDKVNWENKHYKHIIERIDNYLDKNYTAENQYWFDHIRDIIEDR